MRIKYRHGVAQVVTTRELPKPNNSGISKLQVIVAEFMGPDAEENARVFLDALRMKKEGE